MRAVVQRVLRAWVEVDSDIVGSINRGLLVYVGVSSDDQGEDASYLADKVRFLRIFEDETGKLNRDVVQSQGSVLAASAFTVQADARKGRRPTLETAARGDEAQALYESFRDRLHSAGLPVACGTFGAYMKVHSVNDGPICVLLDSRRAF